EMVAEQDPLIRRLKVVAVPQALGGRGPLVVQRHDPGGNELGIEAKAEGVGTDRGQHQPDAVDVLPAKDSDRTQRDRRQDGHPTPEEETQEFTHLPTSIEGWDRYIEVGMAGQGAFATAHGGTPPGGLTTRPAYS